MANKIEGLISGLVEQIVHREKRAGNGVRRFVKDPQGMQQYEQFCRSVLDQTIADTQEMIRFGEEHPVIEDYNESFYDRMVRVAKQADEVRRKR